MISCRGVGRLLLNMFGVPLALALGGVIGLLLINLHGEAPLPDVSQALTARHDTVRAGENRCFPLLALNLRESYQLPADGERLCERYAAAITRAHDGPVGLYLDSELPVVGPTGDKDKGCLSCAPRRAAWRASLPIPARPQRSSRRTPDCSLIYESLTKYPHFRNRLPAAPDVARFVADSPPELWDPYTGNAFEYVTGQKPAVI